jgi:hypothetical protein
LAVSSSHVNEEFGFLENNQITLISLDSDGEIINFNTNVSAVTNGWFLAQNSLLILSGYNTGLEGLEIQLWDVPSAIQEWDLITFTETLELPRIPFITATAASDEIIAMAIRTSTGVQNEYGETLIHLYNPMTLELQGVLELEREIVTWLTIHPEESLLVMGSNTGTINIWNFVTQEIISIDASTTSIEKIIYLDNKTFATISDDFHTLSIWRDTAP